MCFAVPTRGPAERFDKTLSSSSDLLIILFFFSSRLQSGRSQPAIGLRQTPKARVSGKLLCLSLPNFSCCSTASDWWWGAPCRQHSKYKGNHVVPRLPKRHHQSRTHNSQGILGTHNNTLRLKLHIPQTAESIFFSLRKRRWSHHKVKHWLAFTTGGWQL